MPFTPEPSGLIAGLERLLRGAELRRVTVDDLRVVQAMQQAGWLHQEVENRLAALPAQHPLAGELGRLCRDCVGLLRAVHDGRFDPGPEWPGVEARLVKALAYFLRGLDAIPDEEPGGLHDDLREFREFTERAAGLLLRYEAWSARGS